jgi:hypothetical protein
MDWLALGIVIVSLLLARQVWKDRRSLGYDVYPRILAGAACARADYFAHPS